MTGTFPRNWRMVRLSELTLPIERSDPSRFLSDTFDYIDISAVDSRTKRVYGVASLRVTEAPARARQVVCAGDVLVSTVRPALNAVAMVPDNLNNPVASTGFCVLRASSNFVLQAYLYYFVRSEPFIQVLTSRQKGGAYPAVTEDDVLSLQLPLPPLSEQHRIVEILEEAEEIRHLHVKAEARIFELKSAAFFHFFNNVSQQFPTIPLNDLVEEFRYGTSRPAGGRGVPTLRIPNVLGDRINFENLVDVEEDADSVDRLKLQTGDLLFVRTNGNPDYVGRCCVFEQSDAEHAVGSAAPMIFASYLIRARLKQGLIRPWFLHAYLRSPLGRLQVQQQARTAAGQYNINSKGLGAVRALVPPLDLQDKLLLETTEIQQIAEMSRLSDLLVSQLAKSLSAHAFSGQLTTEWRETNQRQLTLETRQRDTALKEAGNTFVRSGPDTFQEAASFLELTTEGIYSDLNREQRALLAHIQQLFAGTAFAHYFSAQSLSNSLEGTLRRNNQVIEGHLAVLAARGILIPVSREEQTRDTGEYVFGNAYRLPLRYYEPREDEGGQERAGDQTRLRELERIVARLEKGRSLS